MSQHSAGRVTLHDPQDRTVGWRIYFSDRQVHFAESLGGQQERLSYLLQRYVPQCELTLPSYDFSDYEFLCQLWRSQQLTLNQCRDFLTLVTQEALIQLLAVPNPHVEFEDQMQLDPILLSVPLWKLTWPVEGRIDQWSLIYPELQSAFQRPCIQDWDKLVHMLRDMKGAYCRLSHLTVALKKNLCLYELASRFKMDVRDLAISIHPLVKCGAVGINPYHNMQVEQPRIACIDANRAVQSLVQRTLTPYDYEVISILNPAQVFTVLAQQPPDLILLDSRLPDFDGYALCRLLRRVESLSDLPIVMLSSKSNLIGGLRTRFCGSTATLAKPLQAQALLDLVQRLMPQEKQPYLAVQSTALTCA